MISNGWPRLRNLTCIFALSGASACLSSIDPECSPCETGGCGAGFVCRPAQGGSSVCVPTGMSVELCRLDEPDAGTMFDAGDATSNPDAGALVDAGSSLDAGPAFRCPELSHEGTRWVPSAPTSLCFLETEVTVRQFEACSMSTTCADENQFYTYLPEVQEFCSLGRPGRRDHPMNCLTQAAATGFCSSIGGRLPTRNEWLAEASNGGMRSYPWGEEEADCTRTVMRESGQLPGCDTGDTFEPCSRPAGNSASGLCDMSGNLWEITADTSGRNYVMCGGGLGTTLLADFLRTESCRSDAGPHNYIGFRCVTDPVP